MLNFLEIHSRRTTFLRQLHGRPLFILLDLLFIKVHLFLKLPDTAIVMHNLRLVSQRFEERSFVNVLKARHVRQYVKVLHLSKDCLVKSQLVLLPISNVVSTDGAGSLT